MKRTLQQNKAEIWKNIEGYPYYQVSNLGRVKSKQRIIKTKTRGSNRRR